MLIILQNWGAHVRWTGPQIIKQLPEIDVICAGMGTAGTMTGIGTYMKSAKPSVTRVGLEIQTLLNRFIADLL